MFLQPSDCTETFFVDHGIRVNHPVARPRYGGGSFATGGEPPAPTVAVMHGAKTTSISLPVLPLVVKLLDLMDWGLYYEDHGGTLMTQRRHLLLNEAVMRNRHDIAVRYRDARKIFTQAEALWESVKGLRSVTMDTRMMQGIILFVKTWPEVMNVAYDGESFEDFEGQHTSMPGEVIIRFWPVLFTDDTHSHTRGLSIMPIFRIDGWGGVYHDFNGEETQPHPHCFTDGSLCNGEARFGESQMQSLKELRNWWVGTDHAPAGGDDWSYQCYDWWQSEMGAFFRYYHGNDSGCGDPPATAYYIEAPKTSMGYDSTYEDRQAEAVTRVLTKAKLESLLEDYNSTERIPEYDYECYVCGDGLTYDDAYLCPMCEEDFCHDHFNRNFDCCERCFERCYQRCIACCVWTHEDDQYCCDNCGETVCRDCVVIKDDPYCPNCATNKEEESTGDITPHDYVQLGFPPKPGWVRDPEMLGGLTCHHEGHGPYTTDPRRPAAAWRFEGETPPLEDMLALRARHEASHNVGFYVCEEHVPRVALAPAVNFEGFTTVERFEMATPEFWPPRETNIAAYQGSYRYQGGVAWRARTAEFREAVIENEYQIDDLLHPDAATVIDRLAAVAQEVN